MIVSDESIVQIDQGNVCALKHTIQQIGNWMPLIYAYLLYVDMVIHLALELLHVRCLCMWFIHIRRTHTNRSIMKNKKKMKKQTIFFTKFLEKKSIFLLSSFVFLCTTSIQSSYIELVMNSV